MTETTTIQELIENREWAQRGLGYERNRYPRNNEQWEMAAEALDAAENAIEDYMRETYGATTSDALDFMDMLEDGISVDLAVTMIAARQDSADYRADREESYLASVGCL